MQTEATQARPKGVSRAGIKYPVRGISHSDQLKDIVIVLTPNPITYHLGINYQKKGCPGVDSKGVNVQCIKI